jgi:hypothetical protein
LYEEGKRLRDKCPRQSHAAWQAPADRPEPLSLLVQSSKGRIPQLIPVMMQYAELCGWTLARAHARSAQPAPIAGYLGNSDKFDKAIADFSIAYADQSERDHQILMKAVREGRLEVIREGP